MLTPKVYIDIFDKLYLYVYTHVYAYIIVKIPSSGLSAVMRVDRPVTKAIFGTGTLWYEKGRFRLGCT